MADYKKNTFVGGKWVAKSELHDKKIAWAKITTETNPEPSRFPDANGNPQEQDVCKAVFEGLGPDALKVSLNRATINALVDAYGESSKNWVGKRLGVEIDKLPGKKFPLYLVPEGYVRVEDESGYSIIIKKDRVETPTIQLNEEE